MSALDHVVETYFSKKVLIDGKMQLDAEAELAQLRAALSEAQRTSAQQAERIAALEAKQANIDAAVDAVALYQRIAALEAAVDEARKIVEAVGSSYDDDRVCEIRVERDMDSAWWATSACIAWLAAHPAQPVQNCVQTRTIIDALADGMYP